MAALSKDDNKIDEVCGIIKECNTAQRQLYFSALLREPQTILQRKTLLEGLIDREPYTRKSAYDIVAKLELTADEYRSIEEYLRFKGSDIRKYTIELLLKQKDSGLTACISRLLESDKEEIRLGGLDILLQLKKDAMRNYIVDSFSNILSKKAYEKNIPVKEKLLLNALTFTAKETSLKDVALFSKEDKYLPDKFDMEYIDECVKTFAEYFPESKLPELISGENNKANPFKKIKATSTNDDTCQSALAATGDLTSLSKLIDAHRTDSFVNSIGESILIGIVQSSHDFIDKDGNLPLQELWQQWARENSITNQRLVKMMVLFRAYKQKTPFLEACADSLRTVFGSGFERGIELQYLTVIEALLNNMCESLPKDQIMQLSSALAIWFILCVPDDMVMLHAPSQRPLGIRHSRLEMAHLLAHKQLNLIFRWLSCKNDANLKYTFPLAVVVANRCIEASKKIVAVDLQFGDAFSYFRNANPRFLLQPHDTVTGSCKPLVGVNEYLYAGYQKVITEAQLYEFLLEQDNLSASMEVVTAVAAYYYEKGESVLGRNSYRGNINARI